MTDKPITYAVVGGPPDNWLGLRVFDIDTGLEIDEVIECNTVEGWLVRYKPGEDGLIYTVGEGDDAEAASERLEGRFLIVPPKKGK